MNHRSLWSYWQSTTYTCHTREELHNHCLYVEDMSYVGTIEEARDLGNTWSTSART